MNIELRPLADIKPYERNPRVNDTAVIVPMEPAGWLAPSRYRPLMLYVITNRSDQFWLESRRLYLAIGAVLGHVVRTVGAGCPRERCCGAVGSP